MATNPYDMLFTDQNTNREFVIQPFTTNGPSTPTGGVDPSAATANTTLFLYGKGAPNYGERIQENMIFMMEHFFNPSEPSFPIPGQIWYQSTSNEISNPYQLSVFNPRKYSIVSSNAGTSTIGVASDDGSNSLAQVQTRFSGLGARSFTVYSPTYVELTFAQTAPPTISGGMVVLTVSPAPPASTLAGQFIGGWEDLFQGNTFNVLRKTFNANSQFIQNLPTPVLPGDAANKAYVDAATTGGTLTLSSLSDVQFATPGHPQSSSYLFFDPVLLKWTDKLQSSMPFLLITGGTMAGTINMAGQLITNLIDPSTLTPQYPATQNYVYQQPLSSQFVTLTAPTNHDLLVYNSISGMWENMTATAAGVLPLAGGVMTGSINMGSNVLTGLITPVNPSDAVSLSYVTGLVGSSGVTSLTYSNITGTLVLTQVSTPTTITVAGFIPTPNNQLQSINVTYLPPDPANVALSPPLFFQGTLGDTFIGFPNVLEDPINVRVNSALAQVDQALGNFTIPRQRIVFPGNGSSTIINLNSGVPLSVTTPPRLQYVVGSNNMTIYQNGVKLIASDFGFYKLTGVTTVSTFTGATFSGSTISIIGNHARTFHPSVNFAVSGTSTTNDGKYTVVSSSFDGTNTNIIVTSNLFATTPGTTPFVASGTGTLTYGPFGLMPGMETGYNFGGVSNIVNFTVTVNGLTPAALSFDTSTTNMNTFGLMCDAINVTANKFYINPIIGLSVGAGGNFVVAGNRTTQFPIGTSFVIRNSTNNDSQIWGPYTVGPAAPTYNAITNQTTIAIAGTVNDANINGIIYQDNWAFTVKMENGTLVFHSNIAGSASSITPSDGGLLAGITGITWPVTITTPLTGTTNPIAPADYAYVEHGFHSYPSSLFEFVVAPTAADVVEVIIDHEVVYNKFNPFLLAVTV